MRPEIPGLVEDEFEDDDLLSLDDLERLYALGSDESPGVEERQLMYRTNEVFGFRESLQSYSVPPSRRISSGSELDRIKLCVQNAAHQGKEEEDSSSYSSCSEEEK